MGNKGLNESAKSQALYIEYVFLPFPNTPDRIQNRDNQKVVTMSCIKVLIMKCLEQQLKAVLLEMIIHVLPYIVLYVCAGAGMPQTLW